MAGGQTTPGASQTLASHEGPPGKEYGRARPPDLLREAPCLEKGPLPKTPGSGLFGMWVRVPSLNPGGSFLLVQTVFSGPLTSRFLTPRGSERASFYPTPHPRAGGASQGGGLHKSFQRAGSASRAKSVAPRPRDGKGRLLGGGPGVLAADLAWRGWEWGGRDPWP